MGVFDFIKGKKYRKCQQNEDGSVDCISYKPTKDGKKVVTATIKAIQSPDCTMAIQDSDGNPDDIADLEEYLNKRTRLKCKQPSDI